MKSDECGSQSVYERVHGKEFESEKDEESVVSYRKVYLIIWVYRNEQKKWSLLVLVIGRQYSYK